ncbi:MAG: transcriptional regulator NrdR [Candidatus Pacearchaeota archaeon]
MKCPYCSHSRFRVLDKRKSPWGIRRRRECIKCKKRLTTYERIEKSDLYVVKKDNSREKFDRDKLEKGIEKAFEKRPVPRENIQNLIDEVEEQIRRKGKKEIKSTTVGNMVSRKIKKLDKVAYIRFASVYRDFEDVEDFKEEINKL